MTTPVTLLCGVDHSPVAQLASRLIGADPSQVVLSHDLTQVATGLVGRTTTWGDGRLDAVVVELTHGCVSCTVRHDILPALVELAASDTTSHIVLALPEVVEPAGFLEAFHGLLLDGQQTVAADHCGIRQVVSVVQGDELVQRIAAGDTLEELGRTAADADDRCLGEVVVHQIETADVVVVEAADATSVGIVRLLNPAAAVCRPDDVIPLRRFDLDASLQRADPSVVPAGPELRREADAWSFVWRARRPLHPQRLHDLLEEAVDCSLRSRGTIWLAGRPEAVIGWESVGPRLCLGHIGSWLDGGAECGWEHAHPERQARAQLDWHAQFGDRFQEIAFTGTGSLPIHLAEALDGCLLSEQELRRGWLHTDHHGAMSGADPFADVFAAGIQQEAS